MIGVGIYYSIEYLGATTDSSVSKRKDYSSLMTTVQVSLAKGELTDREERILEVAMTQWLSSPLLSSPLLPEDEDSIPLPPLPQYIGYIDTGFKKIAIINGNDYRPGEMILGGEFKLAQIHSDHIKLLRRGATDLVDVPIEKASIIGNSK